jgi:hypothetical protein
MAHSGTIIHMRNVPGNGKLRALDIPLPIKKMDGNMGLVPADFEWDGSSVPWIFQGIFPRHNHPIASCRHDWRCRNARNKAERLFADKEFEKDVGTTSWWVTKKVGYIGVRIGAFLGIGRYNY